ncbi:hypothetical protein GCM10025857_06790 [Alicyclobacillus contaminans]|uniref:HK97 gp10 family phage protein n=1 Tax=Alicyclobacillus contaminans TaxID=392016 RepID=UPI000550F194|nr:HK97 gp10 family phage protein [Alicyclobacillus contaminans]GMA49322.1 hypothetical protein GCM10025857_06790 [Alicyclobacillus contaminans]
MSEIRVEHMPDLQAVARAVVDAGAKGLRTGLHIMQAEAARIMRAERYATGHLAQSLNVNVLPPDGGNITGTLSAEAPYAPFVEYDTRPHIAPLGAFDSWATVKGFRATGVSLRRGTPLHSQLVIRGWLAVRKRGTKGIHFMRRAYLAKSQEAVQIVKQRIQEALDNYGR